MKFSLSKAQLVLLFGHVLFTTGIFAALPSEAVRKRFTEMRQERRDSKLASRTTNLQSSPSLAATPPSDANITAGISYTSNWSGYIHSSPPSGTFYAVGSQWVVSALIPGGNGAGEWYGAQWIGIDGGSCGSAILQGGTLTYVVVGANGVATEEAYFWYEWYPNYLIEFVDFDVSVGDTVVGLAYALGPSTGYIDLENLRTGVSKYVELTPPSSTAELCGYTAEWIFEDISIGGGLAPFGHVVDALFSDCAAYTTGGDAVNLDGANEIIMVQNGAVVAQPTYINSSEFSVQYPF